MVGPFIGGFIREGDMGGWSMSVRYGILTVATWASDIATALPKDVPCSVNRSRKPLAATPTASEPSVLHADPLRLGNL